MLSLSEFTFKVDFEVTIVTSFKGVTLEVGGDLETYWKSTAISEGRMTQLTHPRTNLRPNRGGSAVSSPAYTASKGGGQTLTISSLQGNYLYVVIQVTRDLHPVVFFDWLLPGVEFELGVADVTLAQFEALAKRLGRNDIAAGNTVGDWAGSVSRSMVSLDRLLKVDTLHPCPISPDRKTKTHLLPVSGTSA